MKVATEIRKMIEALETMEAKYRAKHSMRGYADSWLYDLRKAKQALEKLWKNSVG